VAPAQAFNWAKQIERTAADLRWPARRPLIRHQSESGAGQVSWAQAADWTALLAAGSARLGPARPSLRARGGEQRRAD